MDANRTPTAEAVAEVANRGGRPATVSDEQVIAVGEQLEQAGKRVSGYLIRAALGGVGRTDRYNELWAKHVAARAAGAEQQDTATDTPLELPAAINALCGEAHMEISVAFNSLLLRVAKATLQHATEANEARIADADRRTAEATAALADAEAAGEKAMDDAEAEIERLNTELQAAAKVAADADHARQQAEALAKERLENLKAAEVREREAHDDATRLQQLLKDLQEAHDAQGSKLASTQNKVQTLVEEKATAEATATQRAQELQRANERIKSLEIASAVAQERADKAQERSDEAIARADKAVDNERKEVERSRGLEARIKDLEQQLATAKAAGDKKEA